VRARGARRRRERNFILKGGVWVGGFAVRNGAGC
jgi:hypothetical protein